tara:strand:+ start:1358 stop:1579 length:222 start_codon:yes stop_codon:yes gene_type:complete
MNNLFFKSKSACRHGYIKIMWEALKRDNIQIMAIDRRKGEEDSMIEMDLQGFDEFYKDISALHDELFPLKSTT